MRYLLLAVLAIMVMACGGDTSTPTIGKGQLALTLPVPGSDAVKAFQIKVCKETNCDHCNWNNPADSFCAPLESENLPSDAGVSPVLGHRFADHYFNLIAGSYCVQATPYNNPSCGDNHQEESCTTATGGAYSVAEGQTTEIMLVSKCNRPDTGGLDVAVKLNNDPLIQSLVYDPSKYVCRNQQLKVVVTAVDPDSDNLVWTWTDTPSGCVTTNTDTPNQSTLTCTANTVSAGHYNLTVMACDRPVDDGERLCASLTFPVHVSCGGSCPACP